MKGYDVFLPTVSKPRFCADGTRDRALFPGYIFCHINPEATAAKIVTTPGVQKILGVRGVYWEVPSQEIANLRRVVESNSTTEPATWLSAGTVVRIESGPLRGVEGIITGSDSKWRIVVSITILQRAASLRVERDTRFTVLSPDIAQPGLRTNTLQTTRLGMATVGMIVKPLAVRGESQKTVSIENV
jgi:hypothetical protein